MTTTSPEMPRWLPVPPTAARMSAYLLAAVALGSLFFSTGLIYAGDDIAWMVPMIAFLIVGVTILHRWPSHPMDWIFLWLGALGILTGAASGAVIIGTSDLGEWPIAPQRVDRQILWLNLAAESANTGLIASLVPLSLLLFPNGRLPSSRWKPAAWLAVAAAVIGVAAAFLNGGWGGDQRQAVILSPYRDTAAAAITGGLFFPLLMGAWVAGAVAMILRYRNAAGTQRLQLKWLAVSAGFALVAVAATGVTTNGTTDGPVTALAAAGMGAPAVGAGIAILRHQLFGIDLVIRRSLIVGGLVVFVTGFYVAIVVGLDRLLGTGGADPALAVAATAAVAIAFQPVQQRLTRLANRLVYGQRTTPYEVLTTFAREVSSAADPDALLVRAASSLADGTGAAQVTVWMRVGDLLQPAAHHPVGTAPGDAPLGADGGVSDLAGDVVAEVRDAGELVGAVALSKARGEPPTPADEALTRRLADQIGVALTNLRLTAELQQRAEDLAASRRRVLTAADDERRTLEQRLSQRAGQRLVALKTGLTLAERGAQAASKAREQLTVVQGILDEGIDELHRLTRGLYPVLLGSEGLGAALRMAGDRSGLSVSIDADGFGRLPAEHEVAIYFCVLEALANVSRHADTSSVRVTLRRDDESASFTVVDAGRGFDPAAAGAGAGLSNLRDRVAALDGALTIRSTPGQGTTVIGHLPLPREEQA